MWSGATVDLKLSHSCAMWSHAASEVQLSRHTTTTACSQM